MTLSASLVALAFLNLSMGTGEERIKPKQEALTITTLLGKEYTNVQLRRVRPDAVVFFHDGGAATIPLGDLTSDLQSRFNYRPILAVEAAQAEALKQRAIRQRMAVDRAAFYQAEQEKHQRWEEQQARIRIAQLQKLTAQYQASAYASAALIASKSRDRYDSGNSSCDRGNYSYGNPYRQSGYSHYKRLNHNTVQEKSHQQSHQNTSRPAPQGGARTPAPTFSRSSQGGAR